MESDRLRAYVCTVQFRVGLYIHFCTHLKPLIPLLDCCFVVSGMRFEKIHILFGKFVFASEATHRRSFKLPEKTVANGESHCINSIITTTN